METLSRRLCALSLPLLLVVAPAKASGPESASISTLMSCVTMADSGVVEVVDTDRYRTSHYRLIRSLYRQSGLSETDLHHALSDGVGRAAALTRRLDDLDAAGRRQAEATTARLMAECNAIGMDIQWASSAD